MEHVVSNIPVNFVKLLNKAKIHILYIEGGWMDKRFISEKNSWIIDGLCPTILLF